MHLVDSAETACAATYLSCIFFFFFMRAAWCGRSLLLDNTYSVQALILHCMPVLQTTAHFELNAVPALKRALKLLQPSLQSKVDTLKVQSAGPPELLITAQHCNCAV